MESSVGELERRPVVCALLPFIAIENPHEFASSFVREQGSITAASFRRPRLECPSP